MSRKKKCQILGCPNDALKNGYCEEHQDKAPEQIPEDEEDKPDLIEILEKKITDSFHIFRLPKEMFCKRKGSSVPWSPYAPQLIQDELYQIRLASKGKKFQWPATVPKVLAAVESVNALHEEFPFPSRDVIPFKNGIYNWRTGTFQHGYKSTDYFLQTLATTYVPDAEPGWLHDLFVDWVGEDNVRLLYQIIGLCMVQGFYPAQKVFMIYGPGGDGKSRYLQIIEKLLGAHNVSHIPPQILSEMKEKFWIYELYRKHANIVGDIPATMFRDTALVKRMTGGDYVFADRKNLSGQNFKSFATQIYSTNQLPKSSDKSEGFYRRVRVVEFKHIPQDQRDSTIEDRIEEAEAEIQGIAIKALNELRLLSQNNWELHNEEEVEISMVQYMKMADPLEYFLDYQCVAVSDGGVNVEDFKEEFHKWCEHEDIPYAQFTAHWINKQMIQKKHASKRITGMGTCWQGFVVVPIDSKKPRAKILNLVDHNEEPEDYTPTLGKDF